MSRQSAPKWGRVTNDEVAEIVNEYPGHFVPFAGIDPINIKTAILEVSRSITELGFKGTAVDPGMAETPLQADGP